jgi:hypothetical protein
MDIPVVIESPDPRIDEVDRAIAGEDEQRAARHATRRAATARLFGLPRLLRWMGASVLVAAALSFLLQGWERGDDIARTFHFLGFTGVLTVAGFLCGLRIGDEKSARTFLGLAIGAVPVHFTVLGALLYSQFPWLSGFADYPAYAHFSAPDRAMALLTVALGTAFLVPVCWTAFLAFARPAARSLTAAYLLANATLLVPTRHPDVIGLLALALLAAALLFDRRCLRPLQALRTLEGRVARALMAAPFLLLVGRTLNLYEASSLFLAALASCLSVVLFFLVPSATTRRRVALASQYASLPFVACAWVFVLEALQPTLQLGVAWGLPLVCLPIAALHGAMSFGAIDGGAPMRRVAALLATGGMTLELLFFPGVLASVGCLATAIAAAAYGHAAEQRWVFVTGLSALAFGLLYHLRYAADLYALSPWGSLAVLGTATVVVAALLERHHRALAAHVLELRGRVAAWNA